MRRILAALVLMASATPLCFGQTATPGRPADKNKSAEKKQSAPRADTRKTIGIMSEIGTSFEVQKIGIMVFGNEKTSVAIESWGIDAFVASKAAAILRANFNVVPIKISKDGVAALAGAPGSLFGDRDGYICNVLRKDQGRAFDYYLKVKAHGSRYEMTNQDLQGLGIVHRQGFDTGYTYIHALFWVELLDGKTCSRLRLEEPATFQHAINGLAREVDASWMPTAANAPQDTQLKEATKALVEQGLTQTLPRLLAAN